MSLQGARLSALARCPRQAAYTALGTTGEEPGEQVNRYLARGRVFEEYVAEQFERKYPGQLQSQREIPWLLGTGHADLYVVPEKLLIEVVSTVAPTGKILDFKINQVQLYLMHDPEATKAAVYVVNPSDLRREDVLPVKVTDERRVWFNEEIRQVEQAVQSKGEIMPACCAESPDDCRYGHMCQFTEQAWAGWEPPRAEDIPEQAVDLLRKLARVDQACKNAKAISDEITRERDELRNDLRPLLAPGTEYQCGGITVKLTPVKGRETFRLAPARSAGAITPGIEETLQPWITIGAPSVRWNLKVDDAAAIMLAEDYGEVPF